MKNIVFIPKVKGTDEKRLREVAYDLSVESWKRWCEKNDCQLFVMEDLVHDYEYMKITWQRYYLFDMLDNNGIEYDQVLMVDADTIVHPDCPNFFEMSEHKYCGVNAVGSMDWICRSIENYSHFFFKDVELPYWKYINGGFHIVNKKHKDIFKQVIDFYIKNRDNLLQLQNNWHCGTDQTPVNFILQKNNVDMKILPYEYNMQDLMRFEAIGPDMLHTRHGYVYHFNCGVQPHPRYWMEETFKYLYGEI